MYIHICKYVYTYILYFREEQGRKEQNGGVQVGNEGWEHTD